MSPITGNHGHPTLVSTTGADRLVRGLERLERLLRPTPILQLEHEHMNLFAKLEFCNPAGSVKDKPAFWILKSAIDRGEIDAHSTVVESSSGNFANALAFFCRALGIRFIPVIDPMITRPNESSLRWSCDTVVKVDELDDAQGYLKTRIKKIHELQSSTLGTYWTNQYANSDAVEAHYRFTGHDICGAFTRLDYVFVGVSTSGTIAGISRRVREKFPRAEIIAVDAEGSAIFGGRAGKRHIPGIGATVVPTLLKEAHIDDVVLVSELDTVAGCRQLLSRHGLFAGGSSGSAYSAINQTIGQSRTGTKPNVLFLCSDRGTSYLDSVFSDEWVTKHLLGAEPLIRARVG